MSMTANLTDKEMDLLYFIARGMDDYGSGWWLDEITAQMWQDGIEWVQNDHAVAGVLGSLIRKGLVWSRLCEDAYWLLIADR